MNGTYSLHRILMWEKPQCMSKHYPTNPAEEVVHSTELNARILTLKGVVGKQDDWGARGRFYNNA